MKKITMVVKRSIPTDFAKKILVEMEENKKHTSKIFLRERKIKKFLRPKFLKKKCCFYFGRRL